MKCSSQSDGCECLGGIQKVIVVVVEEEEDYGLLIHSAALKETDKNMIKAVYENYQ